MNKAQHTPGLLEHSGPFLICLNNGGRILTRESVKDDGTKNNFDEREANARRITSCWNACEGISTEALEGGIVKELLEALEYYAEAKRSVVDGDQIIEVDDGQIARAAIAKAKGE